jgi:hypothetical protein
LVLLFLFLSDFLSRSNQEEGRQPRSQKSARSRGGVKGREATAKPLALDAASAKGIPSVLSEAKNLQES